MNYDDPLSGSRGGQVPNLTRAQYAIAEHSDQIATDIMREIHRGYFTSFHLGQKHVALDKLVSNDILTRHESKNHDGQYYKPTAITRAWCLTSLALADERAIAFKARTADGKTSP